MCVNGAVRIFPAATMYSAVIWLAFLACATPARAWLPYTTDGGVPLRWWVDEVSFVIDPDLPEGFDEDLTLTAADAAIEQWNTNECHPMAIHSEGLANCPGEVTDDMTNCIYWITQPGLWPGLEWLVALTFVHFDTETGEILDVDMGFNNHGFEFDDAIACTPLSSAYDLRATLTHEFGHFVGLDHSTVTDATMNSVTFGGDCKKRSLAEDDIEGFCTLYEGSVPPPVEDTPDTSTPLDINDINDGEVGPTTPDEDAAPPPEDGCNTTHPTQQTKGALFWCLLVAGILTSARRPRRRTSPTASH